VLKLRACLKSSGGARRQDEYPPFPSANPHSGDGGFMAKPVLASGVIWHRSTALSIVSLQEKDEYERLFSIPLPKLQARTNSALILGKGCN
jgi:hypothetical protein